MINRRRSVSNERKEEMYQKVYKDSATIHKFP